MRGVYGVSAIWQHGYPEPNEDFGYARQVYDTVTYCICGGGRRQIAPFRMAREPKWGRRSILELNWVHDELFVRPEVWSELFRPVGVPALAVLNKAGTTELKTVVQLLVSEVVPVRTGKLRYSVCRRCQSKSYIPERQDVWPSPKHSFSAAICRSAEQFYDARFNLIYVSEALVNTVNRAGIRGVAFHPTEP
jgi:hypothetical protein